MRHFTSPTKLAQQHESKNRFEFGAHEPNKTSQNVFLALNTARSKSSGKRQQTDQSRKVTHWHDFGSNSVYGIPKTLFMQQSRGMRGILVNKVQLSMKKNLILLF